MNILRFRPNPRVSRGKAAFTLIELLVVIAIIAILAAILFPVFAKAREKARQTSCMSDEKQIGLALISYTQDYDEKFPSGYVGGGTPQATGTKETGVGMGWAGQANPYIKSTGIFKCADDSTTVTQGTTPQAYPCSYALNVFAAANTQASFAAPAVTVLAYEVANSTPFIGLSDEGTGTYPSSVTNLSPVGDGYPGGAPNDLANQAKCSAAYTCTLNYGANGTMALAADAQGYGTATGATTNDRHDQTNNTSMYLFADGHVKFVHFNAVVNNGWSPTLTTALPSGSQVFTFSTQ